MVPAKVVLTRYEQCVYPASSQCGLYLFFSKGWTQPHHCRVPEGQLLNESIPTHTVDGQQQYQECLMYVNGTNSNKTTACQHGWSYNLEYTTVVSEVSAYVLLVLDSPS